MRRALAALALVLTAGGTALGAGGHGDHGAGAPARIEIGYGDVTPQMLTVLSGTMVHWRNASTRAHTATATDGSFDSGRLAVRDEYSHTFAAEGDFAYYCRLHPTIRGTVQVRRLLIGPAVQRAAPARPYTLRGHGTLEPGTAVTVEADSGAGFAAVTSATVEEDGTFAAVLDTARAGLYRARAGGSTSPAIRLLVVDREVDLHVRRSRRRSVVQVHVTPASPGEQVVLQLFQRQRFGWWPVASARLDHRSRARFVVKRRLRARVLLTLDDLATPVARSEVVRVGRRRAG